MRSYVAFAAFATALWATSARAELAASDAGAPAPKAVAPAADLSAHDAALKAQILKELQAQDEVKLTKLREDLRDEIRAEMTTAQAQPQEAEELPEEKPKLQFLELNGYFRLRANLYENLWLGWSAPDPGGYYLFPKPYSTPNGRTEESADTRLRIEPTLNVSEDIRIKAQVDVLDNLVLGSTPNLSAQTPLTVLSQSQVPPNTNLGNLQNASFQAKRVWAEVVLPPIGELRFGRMGNHWGLGMYQNDGNCLDCDYGNTVDRIMLVVKIANHLIIPMMDWVGAGALTNQNAGDQLGQPVAFDRLLEAYQYGLQIVRRDTDKELKALEELNKPSINYGGYFTLRTESNDLVWNGSSGYGTVNASNGGSCSPGSGTLGAANPNSPTFNTQGPTGGTSQLCGVDGRNATFVTPDLWLRLKTRRFRLESELTYIHGNFTINGEQNTGNPLTSNNIDHQINVDSFGGVIQAEYKFLSELQLGVGLDLGLATGNESYGFGIQPGRPNIVGQGAFSPNVAPTVQGSIDGSPIWCPNNTEPCAQHSINAFSFSRDYHIDQILWRQILGAVTDAWFAKPTISYRFLPGLEAVLTGIYSQAQRPQFTPGQQAPLGLEGDLGVHYATDDGFVANLDYGVLVPFGGLSEVTSTQNIGTSVAQSIRLYLGVKY